MNSLIYLRPLLLAAEEPLSWTTDFLIPMAVVLVLVLVNGFFVAAEFAMLGTRTSRMDQLAEDGNKTAQSVMNLKENIPRLNNFLAASQLGITVVTLVLSMYGEPKIAHFLEVPLGRVITSPSPTLTHTLATIISLMVLTFLHVILGEMVPKSLALGDANKMVLQIMRPMRLVEFVLFVPAKMLSIIGRWLLKVAKIPPVEGHARLFSAEEIDQIVRESQEGGLITQDAKEIIHNIFDFSDREASHVMTPRRKVYAFPIDIAYADLLKQVAESPYSRFPVYENELDHFVGLLHLKDLINYHLNNEDKFDIKKLLRAAPMVPEDQKIEDLLTGFKKKKIHMGIVIDEFGGVAGIVTLEDLVEEIVGEVRDEFDVEKEPFIQLSPGAIEVAGDYLLSELLDHVYLGEEDDLPDVDTVGGLIVTRLRAIPKVNDEVQFGAVKFTVLDVDGRSVSRAKVVFPAPTIDSAADEHTSE